MLVSLAYDLLPALVFPSVIEATWSMLVRLARSALWFRVSLIFSAELPRIVVMLLATAAPRSIVIFWVVAAVLVILLRSIALSVAVAFTVRV